MERAQDFVYLPLAQHLQPKMVLLLRSAGDPLELVTPVKDLVRSLDANLPISEMRTYEDLYRYAAVEGPGIAVRLVTTMGLVALVLAIAGLYGLVAYNVSRRTREIGIRMAVGATPSNVLWMVMGKGLGLVVIGTAIGLAMGVAVEQLMNTMLFNAGRVDFLVYALVVPAMVVVTMFAAYLPARRAAQIEPTQALRYE
jgi:putative ABC transport system permease protein